MSFLAPGTATIASPAFYGVATVAGSPALIREHRDGRQQALQFVPEGSTPIYGPGRGFRYSWVASHQTTMIWLDPAVVRQAASELGIGHGGGVDINSAFDVHDPVCRHLVMVLAEEARLTAHAAQPMIVESLASALALRLLARFSASGSPQHSAPGALTGRTFQQVCTYIDDNVGERISLQDLASVAGVSRFHFARQFRLRTGESPMGYLLRLRIERAKPMLRSADGTIAEIAARLGFADQSHFTRTFRRMVGMPPREFAGSGSRRSEA